MTNQLAFTLFILICVSLAVDVFLHGTENLIFLGRKFFEFSEWLAFWR